MALGKEGVQPLRGAGEQADAQLRLFLAADAEAQLPAQLGGHAGDGLQDGLVDPLPHQRREGVDVVLFLGGVGV